MAVLALLFPFIHIQPLTKDLQGDLPKWLDPLVLDPWQLLVIIGFFIGVWTAQNRARDWGLSMREMTDLAFAVVVGAIFMAHWFHVFLYDWADHRPETVTDFLKTVLNPFYGWSSFGGFVGASIALIIYVKIKKLRVAQYGDAAISGLIYGWMFGRTGCFVVHDHPGKITDSFFGITYPDVDGATTGMSLILDWGRGATNWGARAGTTRFDLGGMELGMTVFLAIFGWWAFKKNRHRWRWGMAIVSFTVVFTVVRFFMDFLRAQDLSTSDPRYFGLTPGQWAAIVMCSAALIYWRQVVRHNEFPDPPGSIVKKVDGSAAVEGATASDEGVIEVESAAASDSEADAADAEPKS